MWKFKLITLAGCLILGTSFPALATEKDPKHQEATQTQENVIAEFFRFASDRKQAIKLGVIDSNADGNKPEKIPPEMFAAIMESPGLETGEGFRAPLNLKSSDADCQLFGLNIQLSNRPDTKQWLVAPLPPCGKYKHSRLNSPFWLVEQRKEESPKVLLAYRAYTLSTLTQKHEAYADILITYQSLDGNDIDINWRYQGQEYAYHASRCSNLSPVDVDEPVFFTNCAPVEHWSVQAERETGS